MSRNQGRGRPPKYNWQALEKPGDTFFVMGEKAYQITPLAAKASQRMGNGAVIRCLTYGEGCWVILVDLKEDIVKDPEPELHTRGHLTDVDDFVDPDADIAEYLIDNEEE